MLEKIKITNFKLFVEKELQFNPEFNLIVGLNGSGKTSVLRAIATSLAGWANAYIKSSQNRRPISSSEIREIQIDARFDKAKETSIEAEGKFPVVNSFGGSTFAKVSWKRYRKEGNNRTLVSGNVKFKSRGDDSYSSEYNLNLSTIGSNILKFIEKGNNFTLPVIAFYECDRLWTSKGRVQIEDSAKKQYSRFEPYLDCFHTGTDDKELSEWLFKQEMISLQKKEKTAISGAIESAVKMALEGCSGFAYHFEESRVIVEFTDGRRIPFEHLSDGQRTIVGLVCDIARRATILNPHLNNNICDTAIGVVLIDELDLHLHPSWQRTVIENLRKVFPKIQFICTTHSAFLIQSLRDSGELIMLDGVPLVEYSSKGIEDIARNMGVERPDVSALYEEMKGVAENFLQTLDREDLSPEEFHEKYKEKLAESIKPYAGNPAFQAVLERKYAKKTGCEL